MFIHFSVGAKINHSKRRKNVNSLFVPSVIKVLFSAKEEEEAPLIFRRF